VDYRPVGAPALRSPLFPCYSAGGATRGYLSTSSKLVTVKIRSAQTSRSMRARPPDEANDLGRTVDSRCRQQDRPEGDAEQEPEQQPPRRGSQEEAERDAYRSARETRCEKPEPDDPVATPDALDEALALHAPVGSRAHEAPLETLSQKEDEKSRRRRAERRHATDEQRRHPEDEAERNALPETNHSERENREQLGQHERATTIRGFCKCRSRQSEPLLSLTGARLFGPREPMQSLPHRTLWSGR
jgi:hypothetical protein